MFLYYVLLHRLSCGIPTAFQYPYGDTFALFGKNGVEVRDPTMGGFAIKEKVWALSDSCGSNTDTWPCQSFIRASAMGNAWLVHVAPLAENRWYPLVKHRETIQFVMNCTTYDEVIVKLWGWSSSSKLYSV